MTLALNQSHGLHSPKNGPAGDPVSMPVVCMTLKPIWINSNRNAFGVNDEENKMPRIVIRDRRMPTHANTQSHPAKSTCMLYSISLVSLDPEPQSQPICQNSSDPDIKQFFTSTGWPTDLDELRIVKPQYMHQFDTYTDEKGHAKGKKHKTEWVTSNQLTGKFQLVFQILAISSQFWRHKHTLQNVISVWDNLIFLDAWELSTHTIWGCNSNKPHNSATRVQNAIFAQVSKDLNQQTNSELLNRAQKLSEDSRTLSIPLACFAVKMLNRLFDKQYFGILFWACISQ